MCSVWEYGNVSQTDGTNGKVLRKSSIRCGSFGTYHEVVKVPISTKWEVRALMTGGVDLSDLVIWFQRESRDGEQPCRKKAYWESLACKSDLWICQADPLSPDEG